MVLKNTLINYFFPYDSEKYKTSSVCNARPLKIKKKIMLMTF